MKKKKITFSEPNCRFGCPHFKSVGSVLNETCYCMKKGKKGRRLGKKDLKRRPPEWCPRRLKTPVCRIYGFKDEMHEALELDNRLNFEPDKHDWYFPSSHHYQLQSEFPLGMTAEQFYNALQEEPVESVLNGTPLLYGTLGEILTEKSGNMNLGVEGILFMGGAAGLGGAFYYEKLAGANASPFVALLLAVFFAFLAGALASLLFSFITITLRANQNVTGLALTIFGTGAGQFLGEYMRVQEGSYVSLSNNLKAIFVNSPFPAFLRNIPVLGPLLFQHNILTYFALALAVFLAWFLNKTRKGLYLRAVGESPATADAAGINVTRYKYLATVLGGGISAIGGVAYITGIAGCVWNHEGLSGVGWLAVALVIFCLWKPSAAIWGSILFGCLQNLYLRLSIPFIPSQIYKILPYIVTVVVLIFSSLRNNREKQPPAALGVPYFREER